MTASGPVISSQTEDLRGTAQAAELIDRTELAQRLDVDVRTVSRMVKRGELPEPCLGQGGRPRWLWSYVIDYCRRRHERQAELDRRIRTKCN